MHIGQLTVEGVEAVQTKEGGNNEHGAVGLEVTARRLVEQN